MEWYNMDTKPPDSSFIGKQIIVSVIPRYGQAYTEAIRWAGLKNYVRASWPIVTHWMPLPEPASYAFKLEASYQQVKSKM